MESTANSNSSNYAMTEHVRMYGTKKHIERDFTPSGHYPVDTIRCYPQQKSKEYYWPTIRTFPEKGCTHTYSLEQQMGPKIRACPPVSTDTTLEKQMGSHKAVFDSRGGIPCVRGGDKAYPSVEYSPGYFKEGGLPGRVVDFDKSIHKHRAGPSNRYDVTTGTSTSSSSSSFSSTSSSSSSKSPADWDPRVIERKKREAEERKQMQEDVLALDNWPFDVERRQKEEEAERKLQEEKEKQKNEQAEKKADEKPAKAEKGKRASSSKKRSS